MLKEMKKKLSDWALGKAGYVWWPQNRDPRIKGPKPRIITIEQARAMERLGDEVEKGGVKESRPE